MLTSYHAVMHFVHTRFRALSTEMPLEGEMPGKDSGETKVESEVETPVNSKPKTDPMQIGTVKTLEDLMNLCEVLALSDLTKIDEYALHVVRPPVRPVSMLCFSPSLTTFQLDLTTRTDVRRELKGAMIPPLVSHSYGNQDPYV